MYKNICIFLWVITGFLTSENTVEFDLTNSPLMKLSKTLKKHFYRKTKINYSSTGAEKNFFWHWTEVISLEESLVCMRELIFFANRRFFK